VSRPAVIPPHDFGAEEAVLGAALLDPVAAYLVAGADPDVFYVESHRLVAAAIGRLVSRGAPVDATTVSTELGARGDLGLAGGAAALALLCERGSISTHFPAYLESVQERATRRGLLQLAREVLASATDEAGPATSKLIAQAYERLLALESGTGEGIVPPAAFAEELSSPAPQRGLDTGVSLIDDVCDGLGAGNLVVAAGRPGMGKTALSLQIARHVAFTRLRPVLFVSLEMTRQEIGYRLLSLLTGLNSRKLKTGALANDPRVQRGIEAIRASGFRIVDPAAPRLTALQAEIRRGVLKHKAVLVIVDHLGKVQVGRRESRYLEVGEIAQALKATAKQLHVPILALAQLNRLVERRNSPRPQLADLRDSGNIEEEADAVVFLWTPEERPEGRDPLPITLTLAKNRHGETGEREYLFEKAHGGFAEASRRDEPDWVRER
jgi:replicative DNA helicase